MPCIQAKRPYLYIDHILLEFGPLFENVQQRIRNAWFTMEDGKKVVIMANLHVLCPDGTQAVEEFFVEILRVSSTTVNAFYSRVRQT